MDDIKTGDLIFTSGNDIYSRFLRFTFGFKFHHVGVALWIHKDDEFGYAKIPSKIYPHKHPDYKLGVYEIGHGDPFNKKLKVKITDINKIVLHYFRVSHLPIRTDLSSQDICDKLYNFILKTRYIRSYLGKLRASNVLFNLGTIDHSDTNEYCVSLVLLWVKELGYDYNDPIVPRRSRSLYSADHLTPSFNRHPMLQEKLIVLVDKKKFNPILFFFSLLFIIILTSIIILFLFYKKKT